MVDVADYTHVPDGPGVVLVCHDAIYSLDTGGGELGLLYSRRRETHPSVQGIASLDDRLTSVFRRALSACARLERERDLAGLSFPGERFELAINDRRVTAAAAGELAAGARTPVGLALRGRATRASRSAAATTARASRRRCVATARPVSASCWRGSTWAWRRGCRERRGRPTGRQGLDRRRGSGRSGSPDRARRPPDRAGRRSGGRRAGGAEIYRGAPDG